MPALIAGAALTAVIVHEDIPGLSLRTDRSTPGSGTEAGKRSSAGKDAALASDSPISPVGGTIPGPSAAEPAADADALSPGKGAGVPAHGGMAALVASPFNLTDSGNEPQDYVIALDEVSVRLPGGRNVTRLLDPPATPETYEDRIAEFAAEGSVMPVVYPAEGPRLPENRRLLTSRVLVEVPEGADRAAAAAKLAIPAENLPSYAPRHVVLKAESPLAALGGLEQWRKLPDLASVQVLLAAQLSKRAMPNDPLVPQQWHLKYTGQFGATPGTDINVEGVWNYPSATDAWRGSGVTVGVVDDGMQTSHPDLAPNVNTAIDYDWNGDDNNPNPDVAAGDFHGTACAGDVAARGNNNLGVSGSAPEATLVGLRLISGPVSDFEIGQSVSHESEAIHIKTNSWGPSDTGSFLSGPGPLTQAAMQNAALTGRGGKGTVMLWAGGNGAGNDDNSNKDGYANSIYAISVTAMDSQMNRSYYAEPGANHLITAPSNGGILGKTTTDIVGGQGYSSGDYTSTFGGTSSATPTAAGVVALMLQRNPNLGYRDVQEILAATAVQINPDEPGWATNSAGFHFNHEYGAGLIDAGAAVAAAADWTNLEPAITASATTAGGAIPESNATGLVRTFDLSNEAAVRAEHVTVAVSIAHTARGELEILITSPSGMTSRLAEVHGDQNDNYNWTFMSTHFRGERSTGTWTLKIADRSGANNTNGGTLASATLTVHGAPAPPINPPPLVQITSPANGAIFTPGSTVTVDVAATDLAENGLPGGIAMVELLEGDTVIGTDTEAPYSFDITPALGSHTLAARATDTDEEPGVSTSATVTITMANSPPVITAATIGGSPAYADTLLSVSGIVASDADEDPITYSYQWQYSTDALSYTNAAGLTSSVLPASAENAAKLWRCSITGSDGQDDGTAFLTEPVNLVIRPQTLVAPGANYSYQSGLVLANNGSPITRPLMINEFSQGSGTVGTPQCEWVELLVLENFASFRSWSLKNSLGTRLTFANSAAWDNLPAGTRVVIYNGAFAKDAFLPPNDTDPSDQQIVISSTDATYFSQSGGSAWPQLIEGGDLLSLRNAADGMVAEVGYGNATGAFINIGDVAKGHAAYHTGGSDQSANEVANWLSTDANTARARDTVVPRAEGDLFISEYINGTGTNKGIELFNPTSSDVNLTTADYKILLYPQSDGINSHTFELSGTIPAGGTFLIKKTTASGFSSTPQQTIGDSDFNWDGNDTILLRKGNVTVDCFGDRNGPVSGAWGSTNTTSNRTWRRRPEILVGDPNSGDSTFNPAVQWTAHTQTDYGDVGKHLTNPRFFGLSSNLLEISETAGSNAATGTIKLPQASSGITTITLTSSDPQTVTVPPTALIPNGQSTATFQINVIDDSISDGSQTVNITAVATASGNPYQNAVLPLTILDDEPPIIGVTPGKGNNVANTAWIDSIINGTENTPAPFRLGASGSLPAGLFIDGTSGEISGTVDPGASGSYNVVIERYNVNGEVTAQSFVLTIGTELTYSAWISGYPGLSATGAEDDPDADGLANVLEFHLGLDPGSANAAVIETGRTATALSITYRRAKGTGGTTAGVEWSDTLGDPWSDAGVTEEILEDNANDQLVKASVTITGADTKKFIRLKVTQD